MTKRKRNSARPHEIPAGIVAVFALVIAFAKASSGSAHHFAETQPQIRVA
jgi:hypothetical protein